MIVIGKYPSLERQWNKLMYAFFNYLPMQYKKVTPRDWRIRRLVWNFKDGRDFEYVARITADTMVKFWGNETVNIVFICVPASSEEKNERRYKNFSIRVCALSGAMNGFNYIKIEGSRFAIHDKHIKKNVQQYQKVSFDESFFKGKKVLIFDDILTKGFSYARFALKLEKLGAEILGGFFLGKTIFNDR